MTAGTGDQVRQLTGLDDAFLALEGPTTPLHVTSLVVLDGASLPDGFGYERVRDLVAARTAGIRQFREVLQPVPLGLDHPYWRVDDHFDVEFHVRHSRACTPARWTAPGRCGRCTSSTGSPAATSGS